MVTNFAEGSGGGVWARRYVPTILTSTITENSADEFGGGISFAEDDTALVERTIVWGNCAAISGDEIYFDENGTADVEVAFVGSDVDTTGFMGPGTWILLADNIAEDPLFIDPGLCLMFTGSNYGIDCNSPCQPTLSPCGERIGAEAGSCVVAVIEDETPVATFSLARAVPNPFSGSTTIHFEVPRRGFIALNVYDLRGRLVRVLKSGTADAGRDFVTWDGLDSNGSRVSPGVYFVRLRTEGRTATIRTVLLQD